MIQNFIFLICHPMVRKMRDKGCWILTIESRGEQKNRKKIIEKTEPWKKNPIKLIKILKKPTGSVRFYKPETEKIEPNLNRKKTKPNQKNWAKLEKTEPNRFELAFILKNRPEPNPVGLNRFQFGLGFFLKKSIWLFFFIKTKPNKK
jgi:hypothetical protein